MNLSSLFNLLSVHTLEFVLLFVVGTFLAVEGIKCRKKRLRYAMVFLGIAAVVIGLSVYLFVNYAAFSVILKWFAIIIGAIVAVLLIGSIIWAIVDDIVYNKRHACNIDIVSIIAASDKPECIEKVLSIGTTHENMCHVVLYPPIDHGACLFRDTDKTYTALIEEQINISDKVIIAGLNHELGVIGQFAERYAKSASKEIVYEIGEEKEITDKAIQLVLNSDEEHRETLLAQIGYSSEGIRKIIKAADTLKAKVPYSEIRQFMNSEYTFDDLKKKYKF